MKRYLSSVAVFAMFMMMGMPFAHGIDPKVDKGAFGMAVSGLAQSYPGAVSDHVAK